MRMTRVTPKLYGLNSYSNGHQNKTRIHHSINRKPTLNVSDGRKVQFDPATIAYQVNYNLNGDDQKHLRSFSIATNKTIETMYPKTRMDMFCWLLKQVTIKQWIKLMIFFPLILQCLWQILWLFRFYKKNHIQTSMTYELPVENELPSMTICMPIIIPFNSRCLKLLNPSTNNENQSESVANLAPPSPPPPPPPSLQSSTECSQTPLISIFNQSISEYGHQCRIKLKSSLSNQQLIYCANLSPPIENYHLNRRCFTYLSQVQQSIRSDMDSLTSSMTDYEDVYISLVIQSNKFSQPQPWPKDSAQHRNGPSLYLHQNDQIPIELLKEPLSIQMGHQYQLRYYNMKTVRLDQDFFKCYNYSGNYVPTMKRSAGPLRTNKSNKLLDLTQLLSREECLNRCYMEHWRYDCGNCFPSFFAIRRDLINAKDKFCFDNDVHVDGDQRPSFSEQTNPSCLNKQEEMFEEIQTKCNHLCPIDCTMIEVEYTVDDTVHDDSGETLITIKRKIQPDQIISQLPLMNYIQFLGYVGGLIMFWLAIIWICSKLIQFLSFCWDMYQLNCTD